MTKKNDTGATRDPINRLTAITLNQESHRDRIIGRRLRAIREDADLSLEELEALSGIPVTCLEEHELGEIPLPMSRVRPIASVLDLHPLDLFIRLVLPI